MRRLWHATWELRTAVCCFAGALYLAPAIVAHVLNTVRGFA
jgi:hypothetical protein